MKKLKEYQQGILFKETNFPVKYSKLLKYRQTQKKERDAIEKISKHVKYWLAKKRLAKLIYKRYSFNKMYAIWRAAI